MGCDTHALRRLMPITLSLLSGSLVMHAAGAWTSTARADDVTYSPNFTRVAGAGDDNGDDCGKDGRGGHAPSEAVDASFSSAITGYAGGKSQGGNGGDGRDSCSVFLASPLLEMAAMAAPSAASQSP